MQKKDYTAERMISNKSQTPAVKASDNKNGGTRPTLQDYHDSKLKNLSKVFAFSFRLGLSISGLVDYSINCASDVFLFSS